MHTVFYDLETSDRFRAGQILSFSFICVDEELTPVDEFSGTIRISRLQLPSPDAVLINRINVIEHNQQAQLNEKEAMRRIAAFINAQIERSGGKLCFAGFNSSRFDLPYLRTSLIRNGVEPYFRGRLLYRDLFHCVRKLAVAHDDFPLSTVSENGIERLSLSLENTSRALSILSKAQSHDAREDVLLSIELASTLRRRFDMDVVTSEAYEARVLHPSVRSGKVYGMSVPNYEFKDGKRALVMPMTLLDCDHRYALWIDLEQYKAGQGRESVRWFSQTTSQFVSDGKELGDPAQKEIARKALDELAQVNLRNYFQRSTCDIEEDIYRLDISLIDILARAIWRGERNLVDKKSPKDLRVVLLRHDLANYNWGGDSDDKVSDLLRSYAIHRYGGEMRTERFEPERRGVASQGPPATHPTLKELFDTLNGRIEERKDPADQKLLAALKEFYLASDIYRLAGKELGV